MIRSRLDLELDGKKNTFASLVVFVYYIVEITYWNFDELCNRYELGYRFRSLEEALSRIMDLSEKSVNNTDWQIKRSKLLDEKIDVTGFQLDLINSWI